MSVELRPLGVKCNIQCQYCYQNPQRDADNILHHYDIDKMLASLEKEGEPFSLFGGEALLIPLADLETLWAWGFERYGQNNVQTNGTLINDEHIRLFKQYNVHVGISMDGGGELNDTRWAGTQRSTREATAKTQQAIEKLCLADIPPGLIITLHQGNASADKLPLLHEWLRQQEKLGINAVRLHLLEIDSPIIAQQYALTDAENLVALQSFRALEKTLNTLRFDIFHDMRLMLQGQDAQVTCVWKACDAYTTRAVRSVEGYGQRRNCGRTNKEGIDFVKANIEGFERYLALYHTPQQYNGCQNCRFFLACKGQCPGTAVEGDWRNRSRDCAVWMALYEQLETELCTEGVQPISLHPARETLEELILTDWVNGNNLLIGDALKQLEK
ncbi:radical SAM protein [Beggiatoa leptomitoformis]|uniref:Radical SAM protein n=1 Tax=Beggiatoa leptomitoformis TaxID=288004 RepID=A0A2N9YA16_9GAMM|nr:radical SAM protein [Beggiatoa leptomitoformis]ALG67274.1 radical SAM protein [Beggiatoa leptomitoformis]AUI67301.1 radical SAM protein [Beggiatoa leptomitoformis]